MFSFKKPEEVATFAKKTQYLIEITVLNVMQPAQKLILLSFKEFGQQRMRWKITRHQFPTFSYESSHQACFQNYKVDTAAAKLSNGDSRIEYKNVYMLGL